jgi:hypothetical protein
MPKVCSNCPFRKDSYINSLGSKRIDSIIENVVFKDGHFICHKTSELDYKKLCRGLLSVVAKEDDFENNLINRLLKIKEPNIETNLTSESCTYNSYDDAQTEHSKYE